MNIAIESPCPWALVEDSPQLRVPIRPAKYRQASFDADYDNTTLFYDCAWTEPGKRALLLGPPLLNLEKHLASMRIVAEPSGAECAFKTKHLDRHSQLWVDTPPGTVSISIESSLGHFKPVLSENLSSLFRDKRVLLTLNKDNKLEWISDWVRFHRDIHGANALLLFDTGSSSYSLDQLRDQLSKLAGIDVIRIVQWNFKFGPQSWFGTHWDSDYCQMGLLENARWRFLQEARSVVNNDIDELLMTNGKSIFELVESSPKKYISYIGKWVLAPSDVEPQPPPAGEGSGARHKDFQYFLIPKSKWKLYRFVKQNACPTKWSVVPSACPFKAQWKTHRVAGMSLRPLPLETAGYRHFREINTSWKYKRSTREPYDASKHAIDSALVECMGRVQWES